MSLYENIHKRRKKVAAGTVSRMRRKGEKGAPTAEAFRDAAKTAKPKNKPGAKKLK